ncbi:MAG: DUF2071 domain-containing protein [Verrucomicrobiota bacterium]|nr:DUF2071 domain-containing protein [Verrucomicrobiota bacterium]
MNSVRTAAEKADALFLKEEKRPLFVNDWVNMFFLHWAVDPKQLQPLIPLPLDLYMGKAWVSVVAFEMKKLRLSGLGALGEIVCKPASDVHFLNLRTYVQGEKGGGIFFMKEWITSLLAVPLGPLLFGLPYQFAFAQRKLNRVTVQTPAQRVLQFAGRATTPLHKAEQGSIEEFLLERYLAYTHLWGVTRFFRISHAPWEFNDARVILHRSDLLGNFPCAGPPQLAHMTPGSFDVWMGPPHFLT